MRKLIFISLLLSIFLEVDAKNYYFSSSGGNDGNTGISPSSAWKTLIKLNNFFASLQPGDSVLLKRGDAFFGSITASKPGTASLPINIGAYGTGNLPIITSLVTPTWTSVGNGIYESSVINVSSVNMVLAGGIPQAMGRYPNVDAANGGFLSIDTHTWNGTTKVGTITDAALSTAPSLNWTGAEAIVKTRRWILERCAVTDQTGNTITYQSTGTTNAQDNWGYFIQNALASLDKPGEWYFNPGTQKLRYVSSTGSPTNVQIATTGTLLNLNSSYIKVRDIEFNGADGQSVNVLGSFCKLTNVTIKNSGNIGLKISGKNNWADSCNIDYSLSQAIFLNYSAPYNKVTNTPVNHSGIYAGMGTTSVSAYNAIEARADRDTVRYCIIKNSGRSALRMGSFDYIDFSYNRVDSSNLVAHDNGAIYAFERPANDINGNPVYNKGRTIFYNIVSNTIGAPYGTTDPKIVPCHLAVSLYFDNKASGIEAAYNTIIGGEDAMFTNTGSRLINIHHNTLFGGDLYQLQINIGDNTVSPIGGTNKVSNNIFFAKTSTQRAAYYDYTTGTNAWNLESLGILDSNYHVNALIGDGALIKDESPALKLSDFKLAHTTLEQHGHIYTAVVTSVNDIRLEFNDTKVNKTINLGGPTYTDVFGNLYTSITLAPFTSAGLIKTAISNIHPTVSVTAPANNATYTSPATVLITATASDADGSITRVNFFNGPTLIGTDVTSPYSFTWTPVTTGVYSITAHARDNNGDSTISTAKNITVSAPANTPPTVSISVPTAGSIITLPDSVSFTAIATDADGTITRVKFYDGTTLFHTENVIPYQFNYLLAEGDHVITAIAFDNTGDSSTSASVSIKVVRTFVPLHIVLTPDSVLCNGGTAKVDVDGQGGTPFTVGDPYIGIGSYTRSAGTHQLIIRDSLGVSDTGIVVMTEPAILSASPPSVGTVPFKSSAPIYISVTGGITPYQYRICNGSCGPWQYSNGFTVFAGTYIVEVKDFNGCTTSTSFTVTQQKPGRDKLVNSKETIFVNP